jgi:hypothetical protein
MVKFVAADAGVSPAGPEASRRRRVPVAMHVQATNTRTARRTQFGAHEEMDGHARMRLSNAFTGEDSAISGMGDAGIDLKFDAAVLRRPR